MQRFYPFQEMNMKAITIKQPWASLIVSGLKDIENRTWKTNFRGRVLIHAGMKADNHWSASVPVCDKVDKFLREISKGGTDWSNYHFGAIIGSVEIVDCVQNHPSLWAEKGVWNWVLSNPIMFPEPIADVKGKLSFWDYDGELPQPKQEKPQQLTKMPDIKELQEKKFRDDVSESTRKMMERLTLDEQMRVSFVPLIITHLAWVYADKAMACAARDKVSLLKKLSRTLKMVHQKYNEELRRELDYNHLQNVIRQTEMCISEINRDLTILYFSVNQELKRKVPQYGFDEQRTYAVISTLFIDLLKQHNREMDKLLAEKLNDRNLAPSIVPPLIQHLHTGMVAFAGVEGKFDYREQNVVTAMKVIKNRIDSIEFSVF